MDLFLLDGVGAAFILVLFGLGLVFLFLAIFGEAWIIQALKYVPAYKTALVFSLVANLVSLGAGFILTSTAPDLFHFNSYAGFGIMFAMTVMVEFGVLYLMNRDKPAGKTFQVSLLMNLASYLVAFLIIQLF